ncbi:hypothetical protein [Sorangium sp. So ce131]|uniref:hypothetical protein n=1 Tax=Sorangium sp. So ce131 TaxID=3133282 RepID=UPI003F60E43D
MLSNAARFLMVSAAASLVALGSAPAEACGELADAALDIIAAGTSVTSGGPFLTLSQQNAWGYTSAQISSLWGSTSPSSVLYYDHVVASPATHFTRVTNIAGIEAGDVFVIDEVRDAEGNITYRGHTAIVTGAPTQLATALKPLFLGTKQYALPIADSTSSVHGCNADYPDSRWSGACDTGTFAPGPGTAYVRLYTNSAGSLLGYSWAVATNSTYNAPSARPYAIGKLNSCPPL